MTELSEADRAALNAAWDSYVAAHPWRKGEDYPSPEGIRHYFYAAGVAAERERCAKVCEEYALGVPMAMFWAWDYLHGSSE